MSREFTKVGVIGLGTMGVGIVEVFARNGIDVVAMEVDDAAVERGKGVLAKSTGRALDRGKITQEDHDALHARVTHTTDMGISPTANSSSRQCPSTCTSRRSSSAGSTPSSPRCHPGDQHLLTPRDRDRRRDQQPQARRRHALLQPGTRPAVRGGHPHGHHGRRRVRGRQGARRAARQEAGHRRRQGRLHRQCPALRVPQPRRGDVRVEVRDPRGHRRFDALRLRLPDGPLALLDLIGLDTAYEILDTMYKQGRDRLHAPSPIIKQMVSAGLKGRKNGRGFYTYAAAGSPEVVADAQTPPREPAPASRFAPSSPWASSARGRWPPGSSRSSPRPGMP